MVFEFSQRKKLDAIRQMLSRYVPQLYAFTAQGVKEATVNEKLEKLIGVWEGHKYFDDGCYKVSYEVKRLKMVKFLTS